MKSQNCINWVIMKKWLMGIWVILMRNMQYKHQHNYGLGIRRGNIDGNHVDHTQIHLLWWGCIGCEKEVFWLIYKQWDSWLASIIDDFWWVLIWMGRGGNSDVFLWLGDGWHEKKQDKDLLYSSFGSSGAMLDLSIDNVDTNHVDHT